jgi:hypothetical protein
LPPGCCPGWPPATQTVDQIIAKSLAARGGIDKVKAIQTQRLTGHISFGPDADGPFQVEIKRGGKIREELTLKGKTIVRISDGTSGWIMEGEVDPRPLSGDDLKNLAGSADIEGALLDYKAKGNNVELLGKEQVEGKDAYKLVVTEKNGRVRYDYIDCASYLGVKWEGKILANGKELQVASVFRDYRPVDGILYAFAIDSETIGTPYKQHLVLDKVEVNSPMDDARFGKPGAQPAEAKPAP